MYYLSKIYFYLQPKFCMALMQILILSSWNRSRFKSPSVFLGQGSEEKMEVYWHKSLFFVTWLVSWGIRSITGSSKWGENRGWHRCVTFDEFVQFRRCHLINETTRVPGLYCSLLNPELYYPSSSLSISSPSPSPSSTYKNYEGKVWGLTPLWSDPHRRTLNVQCSYFLF